MVNESGRALHFNASAMTCGHLRAPWATITPSSFTLAPNAQRHVTLAVSHAPAGRNDVLATFTAPGRTSGNVSVQGSVISVLQTGTGTSHTCVALSAPHSASSLWVVPVIALALVLVSCGTLVAYVRRSRGRRYAATHR